MAVEACLPNFGGPSGAAVVSMEDEARARLASAAGPYVSQVSSSYRLFQEALFRETLDDWGRHATGSPPRLGTRAVPAGTFTPEERIEYAEIVRLNDTLSLLKLQAENLSTLRTAS